MHCSRPESHQKVMVRKDPGERTCTKISRSRLVQWAPILLRCMAEVGMCERPKLGSLYVTYAQGRGESPKNVAFLREAEHCIGAHGPR